MPHAPIRSSFTPRFLAVLLVAAFLGAALSQRHVPRSPTPVLLAGDDDKAGMGVG